MWRRAVFIGIVMVVLAAGTMHDARPARALWVWDTAPLLHDGAARGAFFDFCDRHRIKAVAIYIGASRAKDARRLTAAAEWKTLIAGASRRGIRVHALDGEPDYALGAQHETVLSIVDAVIAYNASVDAGERFFAMHFDIEPYLLPEWKDPAKRQRILAEYLDLNARAAARSHAAGLEYGVDVPFWWHRIDDATGEAIGAATFRAVRKPATEHLLDMVDNVAVMTYRTEAAGPDGIITHGLATIERANSRKARVVIGVETEKVSEGVPARVTFAGKSLNEMEAQLNAAEGVFIGQPAYRGIAIHRYTTFRQMSDQPGDVSPR